jgi:hypothetical protein
MQSIGIRAFKDGVEIVEDKEDAKVFYRRRPGADSFIIGYRISGDGYVFEQDVKVCEPESKQGPAPPETAIAVLAEVIGRLRAEGVPVRGDGISKTQN